MLKTLNGEFVVASYIEKVKIKKVFSIRQLILLWQPFLYCIFLRLVDKQDYLYGQYKSKKDADNALLILSLQIDTEIRRISKKRKNKDVNF